jgi:hypothetical protein
MPAGDDTVAPISEKNCLSVGGTWTEVKAWEGMDRPDCIEAPSSADNHLGMSGDQMDTTGKYMWRIPNLEATNGKKCVLRVRYNISASHFDSHADFYGDASAQMVDSSFNCNEETGEEGRGRCSNKLDVDGVVPLYDDPYVNVFEDLPNMGLAIDTSQVGRTFQDRSHVFEISQPSSEVSRLKLFANHVQGLIYCTSVELRQHHQPECSRKAGQHCAGLSCRRI